MNAFLYILILPLFGLAISPPEEGIDSSQDKIKVEQAVVAWADSTFYSHSNYKFENFRAEYSEEYFIATERAKAYKERVTDLEKEKAGGQYRGTQEAYDAEHKTLTDSYLKIQTEADNCKNRADYYLIHFWSNIQTNDGITVYYEHIMKLDNAYHVIEATINSAIGKKDENTMPIYKKDLKSTDSKKKVDSNVKDTSATTEGGSVTISYETPVEETPPVTEEKPKKEKKKKKK